jgi:hypothetical protein
MSYDPLGNPRCLLILALAWGVGACASVPLHLSDRVWLDVGCSGYRLESPDELHATAIVYCRRGLERWHYKRSCLACEWELKDGPINIGARL